MKRNIFFIAWLFIIVALFTLRIIIGNGGIFKPLAAALTLLIAFVLLFIGLMVLRGILLFVQLSRAIVKKKTVKLKKHVK